VRVLRLLVFGLGLVLALEKCGFHRADGRWYRRRRVGVGLATQGVLSNVVAGLTIIFTKPFRVGEYIEMAGVHGQVVTIELFSTVLVHADRCRVVIPNRKIVGEILHNHGMIRQLDLSVGVGYQSNIKEVLALVREILKQNRGSLKTRRLESELPHLGSPRWSSRLSPGFPLQITARLRQKSTRPFWKNFGPKA